MAKSFGILYPPSLIVPEKCTTRTRIRTWTGPVGVGPRSQRSGTIRKGWNVTGVNRRFRQRRARARAGVV
ncbi:hypothetical protein BJY01DRAFT_100999 [Aspergillus pseudoustus]|uniref:Uncharacterized protein n=1 Tax=Aspergillus pseudoustus TaxID=1810923 RepID=A0ABR4IX48_9EURO